MSQESDGGWSSSKEANPQRGQLKGLPRPRLQGIQEAFPPILEGSLFLDVGGVARPSGKKSRAGLGFVLVWNLQK